MSNQSVIRNGFVTERDLLDVGAMRPFIGKSGQTLITVKTGSKVVKNEDGTVSIKPTYQNRVVFKNAILRAHDWEQIDTAVLDISRQPLVGVSDLAGLTQRLDGLGVSISTYDKVGDMSPASVAMSIRPHKAEKDLPGYESESVPIPVIMKPFELDIRTLEASRRQGHVGLDVTGVRIATLKVREAMEDMVFNGSDIQVGTFKIYGYTNAPNRIADTATNFGGGDFGTIGNAHKTIRGMISALVAKGFYGPYGVYLSSTQYAQLLTLIGANLSETELSTILRTIPDVKFVRRAPLLSSSTGEAIVVNLTRETVDFAVGQDVKPISWQEYGGLMNEFMVIAAVAPRIKSDALNQCGVAYASGC